MLISQIDIQETLAAYEDDDRASYDELVARMQEVKTQIETARTLLWSAMQEIPAPFTNPAFEALALANDRLGYALTAWED
jgi:hypothetical protein